MEKRESLQYVAEKLKKYGAEIYNYRGTEFIGIKNSNSDNHMALTFNDEEFCMEFTYQTARFAYGNEDDCVMHAEKYLTDKLCAVEIFLNGKPLFGGSREIIKEEIKSDREFANYYACGNEQIANNLLGFIKNGGVSVKILSWSGKYDQEFEILVEGEQTEIKKIK